MNTKRRRKRRRPRHRTVVAVGAASVLLGVVAPIAVADTFWPYWSGGIAGGSDSPWSTRWYGWGNYVVNANSPTLKRACFMNRNGSTYCDLGGATTYG